MRFALLAFLILLFGGCANKNAATQNTQYIQVAEDTQDDDFEDEFISQATGGSDPFEGYNRAMTKFNDVAIRYVMIPVAKGYKTLVPGGMRTSLGNFFNNLLFPVRVVNNLLQGKVSNALGECGRFIINTTVGFLGFANVASNVYEIKEHNEDFGQTLGFWGLPSGPHLVLPFFGPSNIRDMGGRILDTAINPMNYFEWRQVNMFDNSWQSAGAGAISAINDFSQNVEAYGTMTKDVIDLYPFMKNMYEQRRNALIKE